MFLCSTYQKIIWISTSKLGALTKVCYKSDVHGSNFRLPAFFATCYWKEIQLTQTTDETGAMTKVIGEGTSPYYV